MVNIEIRNNENELQYSENNVVIVVGTNRFDKSAEENLAGMKSGDTITVPVSSLFKKYYQVFEFYQYLFKIKSEELEFEYYMEDKNSFFDAAFKNCKFNISEDDLKNFSLQIVNEYK